MEQKDFPISYLEPNHPFISQCDFRNRPGQNSILIRVKTIAISVIFCEKKRSDSRWSEGFTVFISEFCVLQFQGSAGRRSRLQEVVGWMAALPEIAVRCGYAFPRRASVGLADVVFATAAAAAAAAAAAVWCSLPRGCWLRKDACRCGAAAAAAAAAVAEHRMRSCIWASTRRRSAFRPTSSSLIIPR